MPHNHNKEHLHVTETFGVHAITPRVVAFSLRIHPTKERHDRLDAERVQRHITMWINRWAKRYGYTFGTPSISRVGGNLSGTYPDAIVAATVAFKIPDDWVCFASLFSDAFLSGIAPRFMPIIPGSIFDLPDIELEVEREEEKPDPIH